MEDILEIYTRPYDLRRPVMCDVREPLPMRVSSYTDSTHHFKSNGLLGI